MRTLIPLFLLCAASASAQIHINLQPDAYDGVWTHFGAEWDTHAPRNAHEVTIRLEAPEGYEFSASGYLGFGVYTLGCAPDSEAFAFDFPESVVETYSGWYHVNGPITGLWQLGVDFTAEDFVFKSITIKFPVTQIQENHQVGSDVNMFGAQLIPLKQKGPRPSRDAAIE
jgi:hypothetical protein